jgi:hypothetical protein
MANSPAAWSAYATPGPGVKPSSVVVPDGLLSFVPIATGPRLLRSKDTADLERVAP